MRHWIGTSGFSYKEWKGSFYPDDLPADAMLAFYSERLKSVEINNTFYRMPNRKTLAGWAERTPDTFKFVLKASQKITHRKRLNNVAEELDYLIPTMGELSTKLGPTLVQLPPNFKKNIDRLTGFLDLLPPGFQAAFEFRNATWFDQETFDLLRSRGQALVTSDTGDEAVLAVEKTAPFAYARLRREEYTDEELADWAERFQGLGVDDLYVFFKHEDGGTGPRLAQRFVECLE